ncbi:MAG: hypothetical protein WEE89_10565 [Gemmatimonadota bacterium]
MHARNGLALVAAAAILVACSIAAPSGGAGFNRNRITPAQLEAANVENMYQAVEKLRPEWLTSRGPTSITDATLTLPSVYINGQMLGKPDYLREISVMDVSEARFWPTGEASARFGMGHPRGVIELTRK